MEGEIEPVGDPEDQQGQGGQDQPLELTPEELSRARALERLDEVEEGSPRVVIQGEQSEDQDW